MVDRHSHTAPVADRDHANQIAYIKAKTRGGAPMLTRKFSKDIKRE